MLPPGVRRLFRLHRGRVHVAQEIQAELDAHLRRRAEDLMARGWPPDEALAEARARFGPVDRVAAECERIDSKRERELMRREWWTDIGQDLGYAVRGLRRSPAAAAVAALTFALGIGVNAAVFSLVDGVVLKPLPYDHAGRIVRIYERDGNRATGQVTIADFRDWREQSAVLDGMAVLRIRSAILHTDADNVHLPAAQVSAGFFDLLGVTPALGRAFAPDEEAAGATPVVVVSHALWQSRLGSDPDVVGRPLRINGSRATLIGVLPPSFVSPMGMRTDVWMPSDFSGIAQDAFRSRYMHFLASFGRLRPGATLAQAEAELQTIGARLEAAYPEQNAGHRPNPGPLALAGIQSTRPVLLLTLGAVGLVLLIACANLANLIYARSLRRSREFAVRAALGADRSRLVRQVLTEQGVLGVIGGAIGVGAAAMAIPGMVAWLAPVLPRAERVALDGRVLLVAAVLSVVASILSGLLPAAHAGRASRHLALTRDGRGGTASPGGRRLRAGLVGLQVALSVVLLAGAGLVVRSLGQLLQIDLGFEPENVLTFSVPLTGARYADAPARVALQTAFLREVAALPGVTAAGMSYAVPMQNNSTTSFDIPERPFPPGQAPEVGYNTATSAYFRALGVRRLSGRLMDEGRDRRGAPPVVVINRRMAELYWPGEDPVGRFLRSGPGGPDAPPIEIIGVVEDIRRESVYVPPEPELYFAATQDVSPNASFTVRAAGDLAALEAGLRTRLRELDSTLPLANVVRLREVVNGTLFRPRFLATLFSGFALLALVLAAIGIYGVTAFVVAEQTRELGIRRALGATTGRVRREVILRGMMPVVGGLAAGLLLAVALTGGVRAVRSMLYEIAPTDPVTLAGVVAVTLGAGLVGCLAPSRRATRIDPVIALREE
jgi:predicted permease